MLTFCKFTLRAAMVFNKNTIRLKHKYVITRRLAASLLIISSLAFSQSTYAQETETQQSNSFTDSAQESNTNKEYSANEPIIKDEFEWQFSLDFSLVYDPKVIAGIEQNELKHYFMPGLLLDISYKGFFLQTNQRRSNALLGGTELGYQFIVQENWQLDLIAKAYMPGYDSESLIEYGAGDEEVLSGLRERGSAIGLAIRYSQYFDNALFTIDFAGATPGDDAQGENVNGIIIDSFYSYLLPLRNWDIYLGAGLTYFSQDIVDYYIGVSPEEATDIRAEYTADKGFRAQLEVYAQYPLSASWSFNTGITHSAFSNNVKESPLVDTNQVTQVMLGVLYVF